MEKGSKGYAAILYSQVTNSMEVASNLKATLEDVLCQRLLIPASTTIFEMHLN